VKKKLRRECLPLFHMHWLAEINNKNFYTLILEGNEKYENHFG